MKALALILCVFIFNKVLISQNIRENETCLLLEAKAGSKESRVLNRVEQIIGDYRMKKEKFYVDMVFSESGDTLLLFSKNSGFCDVSSRQCGILKGKDLTFYISCDGKEIKKFFHLIQLGLVDKPKSSDDQRKKRGKKKISKYLDIYVYKGYDEGEQVYVIFFEYERCRKPSDRFILKGYAISQIKKKRFCNLSF